MHGARTLVLSLLLVVACTDDSVDTEPRSDAGAQPSDKPAIVVLDRVCTPEGCNHYLYAMEELPSDGKLDRTQGLELGDVQGALYDEKLYLFDREEQTITRWRVEADLGLSREKQVSFQDTGVTQLDAISNAFVSKTRAFALDAPAGVLVTWDPSSMEIVAATTLPDSILSRDGAPLSAFWPITVDDRVYYSASWYDYDNRKGYESAALLSFDATQDEPELETLEDKRCGITSSVAPFVDERGDIYFAGDWYTGFQQIGVPESLTAPNPACLLRVAAKSSKVDPEFYVDLLELADARAVTSAMYLGDGRWLMNIWPNSAPPLSAAEIESDPEAYFAAKSFEYVVIVDLKSGERISVSGLPEGVYGGLTPMFMDGIPYIQIFPPDGLENGTNLYAVEPTGEARRVLSAGANGDFELIGRVR